MYCRSVARRVALAFAVTFCLLSAAVTQAQEATKVDAVRQNLQNIQNADRAISQKALGALNRVGPEATESLPALVEAIKSENRLVREVAKQLIRRIDPQQGKTFVGDPFDPVRAGRSEIQNSEVGENDWPQLGGSRSRNNTPPGKDIPTTWMPGIYDRRTGDWMRANNTVNIKWVSKLGSQSFGNIVVANGRIFVGTNNGAGYLKRFPNDVDLGCLLCFRESDGEFLWQHSSEKLATGRVHDWPLQGICSAPIVQGDRLWFVTSRGEVVCLDSQGFHDGEDDGSQTGVWSRLFETIPDFHGLEKHFAVGVLPLEYRSTLAALGVSMFTSDHNFQLEAKGPPNQWLATTGNANHKRMYRITLGQESLLIQGLDENTGEQVSIETNLLAGLDTGRMSHALQAQFKAAGIEVSDETRPTVLVASKSWAISTVRERNPVELRLDLEGRRVVCYQKISPILNNEADVVWSFDMMSELGARQHNMATCAPTIWGDTLFICTSNGVDQSHDMIPAPDAPSFLAMNKHTGKVLWTDNSPGQNILHGQWSCPVVGVFDDIPQVIFPGGDGWLYGFRADRWNDDKPELLWKFDGNPKDSKYSLDGRSTRNGIISVPVVYDGLVYLAMGEDPEYGEGEGHLWCVDPTKRGDVSAELVVDSAGNTVPHGRFRATTPRKLLFQMKGNNWSALNEGNVPKGIHEQFEQVGYRLSDDVSVEVKDTDREWLLDAIINGDKKQFVLETSYSYENGKSIRFLTVVEKLKVIANSNSAVVWHYDKFDLNDNGKIDGEETMHRTIGSPTIKNDLLFITDLSGLCHCVNAKTGIPHWTCDLLAACWSTPLIVEDNVYVGDEDGDIAIFGLSADSTGFGKRSPDSVVPAREINMGNGVYMMPIVANNVLYIATKTHLYAIATQTE